MRERIDRYFLRGCFADTGIEADPGSGGAVFLVDETSTPGTVVPYSKVAFGASGTQTPVSASDPMPVVITGSVSVSGSVTVSATNLDIRDLSSSADSVAAVQSGTWNIGTVTAVTAITNALPSGSNVIGHVITDTGSTTAVTGNVTAVQATGSNLHMVVDSGTVTTVSTVTSLSQFAGTAIAVNSGNKDNGTLRVVIATDQIQLTNKLLVTPDANSAINVAQVGGNSVSTSGNGVANVTDVPGTSGGWAVFNGTSSDGGTALTATAQVVKASAGQVGGWYIYNPNSGAQFVQIYNTAAASVTVGTTAPLFMLTIPATSAANAEFGKGIAMSNAFSAAATSTAGGNGAPSTALDAVLFFK